jgi:hypothetical protein
VTAGPAWRGTLARAAVLSATLAGAAAAALAARPATALDLETLMGRFAASPGVEAEFREEKTLPLLVAPLVSEGVIYFAPPDRMLRLTREPTASSLLVTGDRLRMEDALGVEEVDLAARPVARRFVEQLLLLFRGDLAGLRREYEVAFQAEGSLWSLRLVPRDGRVRKLIREVTLRGDAGRLAEMVLAGSEGELTRTTYGRVVTDRAFGADEIKALFPARGSPSPPVWMPAAP